jgi:hypothetical protein
MKDENIIFRLDTSILVNSRFKISSHLYFFFQNFLAIALSVVSDLFNFNQRYERERECKNKIDQAVNHKLKQKNNILEKEKAIYL